jgi:ABC-type nitrate/sulfonate/bicarbonate transport system substrate-binding protein
MGTKDRQAQLTRREFLRGGAAVVAVLGSSSSLLVACGDKPATSSNTRSTTAITYVTPQKFLLSFAPVLVASAGGFFEEQGLDVDVQGGSGSATSIQQVLGSQALLSRTGGIDLMQSVANEGAPLISVATIAQASPFWVMSPASSSIESIEELKGKTVGLVSLGGGTEGILNAMLRASNIDPSSVERRAVGDSSGAWELMQRGRLAAYIASTSTLVALRHAGKDVVAWNTDKVAPMPGQVYVTTREHADSDADAIVAFLRGVRQAIDLILSEGGPKKAVEMLQQSPFDSAALDNPRQAAEDIEANSKLWTAEGRNNILRNVPELWKRGYELLTTTDTIDGATPVTDMYTNALVDRALPGEST